MVYFSRISVVYQYWIQEMVQVYWQQVKETIHPCLHDYKFSKFGQFQSRHWIRLLSIQEI